MTTSWDAERLLCCSSCGVPWVEDDQEEYLADRILEGIRRRESRALEFVKDCWKEHIHEWIDDVEEENDVILSNLFDVWEYMHNKDEFYCENCNNSVHGKRCYRNMSEEHRKILMPKKPRKREGEEEEKEGVKRVKN